MPATAGARFVVSERGDILSPKYAPEITIPAVSGAGTPRPSAMPMMAIPTVPVVPHEVPVASDTIDVMMRAANRKIAGLSIARP